jgi:hypothetical protein
MSSRMSVAMAEIASDAAQPRRLEKKKNNRPPADRLNARAGCWFRNARSTRLDLQDEVRGRKVLGTPAAPGR